MYTKHDRDCPRYDVLLTANHPSRTYFITVASQYRPGAPNGYGFLRYNASAVDLPPTPTVQENATLPWNHSQIDKARSPQRFIFCYRFPFELRLLQHCHLICSVCHKAPAG